MRLLLALVLCFFVLEAPAPSEPEKPAAAPRTAVPQRVPATQQVRGVMKRAFEAQLAAQRPAPPGDWVHATLYIGACAAHQATDDPAYLDAALAWATELQFAPRKGKLSGSARADDQAATQVFLYLARVKAPGATIEPTRQSFDDVLRTRIRGDAEWWWCDAAFMAPPAMAMLAAQAGKPGYLDRMDEMWWQQHKFLCDPAEKLYYRDKRFLPSATQPRVTSSGKPVFWARGNAWVMAGTVRVLAAMPPADPRRKPYEKLLNDMAERVVRSQGKDGLWRTSLADPDDFPDPEASSTGLFCYALAWGVNAGVLDAKRYLPPVLLAWRGLEDSIDAKGRLARVQRIGHEPEAVPARGSTPFGTGAMLLAGSEVLRLK